MLNDIWLYRYNFSSVNSLRPSDAYMRRQAIIWTNAGILLIGPLGTNFSEILGEILTFSFTKMRLKVSSVKWRPFCLGLNVLKHLGLTLFSWFPTDCKLIRRICEAKYMRHWGNGVFARRTYAPDICDIRLGWVNISPMYSPTQRIVKNLYKIIILLRGTWQESLQPFIGDAICEKMRIRQEIWQFRLVSWIKLLSDFAWNTCKYSDS